MPKITCTHNTALKKRLDLVSGLGKDEKIGIKAGQELAVYTMDPIPNSSIGPHTMVTLDLGGWKQGIVYDGHWSGLGFYNPAAPIGMQPGKQINANELQVLCKEFDLEPAVVQAVMEVEASGEGFTKSGKCKILFEAHWFGYYTNDKYTWTHPDISAQTWSQARQYYKGGDAEWGRFERAAQLDPKAAMMSISMGLGQIMGFNHKTCGYATVEKFFEYMCKSEYLQMQAMFNFIANKGLLDELQRHDWAGFAYGYNGEGYKVNHYDTKLAAAYNKYKSQAPIAAPVATSGAAGKIHDVVFWKQTDNYVQASRTCFSSSCAMFLKWHMPDAINSDDEYLHRLINRGFGDTTNPAAQVRCLKSYGLNVEFRDDYYFPDLDKKLKEYPVPMGMLHRGSLNAPTGGHWFVNRGLQGDGQVYRVNDPWGSINDSYQGPPENGKNAPYSRAMLKARWEKPKGWPEGGFVIVLV